MSQLVPIGDLGELRRLLEDRLPWTPVEFVPGISKAGDRAIVAEELSRPLSAKDDLRFFFESSSGESLLVLGERLAWDSEFFGCGIAKLHYVFPASQPRCRWDADDRPALEGYLRECRRRGIAYVFAPVDPRDLPLLRALGELGFVLIETRYFHHGPIPVDPPRERLPVRRATENDLDSLIRAAAASTNPYDRFHADPFFRKEDIARLMARWVEESVAGRMADLVIVPDVPSPSAFVTYRYHRDRWDRWRVRLAQGVLSAVSPEFRGWMEKVDAEIFHHLHAVGVEHVYGSTQVTNTAILQFAENRNSRFGRCEHIFRLVLP